MKQIKPLIKHELRTVSWVALYFLLMFLGYLSVVYMKLQERYLSILEEGIRLNYGYGGRNIIYGELFYKGWVILITVGVGIVILVFSQFKDMKDLEVGRFLKGLPYTNKQYYAVRTISGVLSYTLPFLVFLAGVLMIRRSALSWVGDLYHFLPEGRILMEADGISHVLDTLLMYYLTYTFTYFVLVTIQYIISHNLGSIIAGICTIIAPIFIMSNITEIYRDYIPQNIIEFLDHKGYYGLQWISAVNWDFISIESMDGMIMVNSDLPIKIGISLVLVGFWILFSYKLSEGYHIENNEVAIPAKWARIIFVIGFSICFGLLLVDIFAIVWSVNNLGSWIGQIILCVGILAGIGIARKIASIGIRR